MFEVELVDSISPYEGSELLIEGIQSLREVSILIEEGEYRIDDVRQLNVSPTIKE